ncbi:IDEAL domain-containing protein [Bhargavaea beijingensis]|uniref:IDEAL domain-containing protein n=1 Tax=Bhargavaea beijingensis TaxID=426756 RepID=A0A1G7GK24_9BACL|nr:IDEAL domain-containing protein [Bhargavaea beijingensis]MCW1927548.1 IDEAL domain-containing protein [Bhargavaea beijingensis]RSK34900.1 IDEAL domain-containing protein [Bhargavaea beijingensis]SDE88359.1 IDEAL domain-containing protein [Bhargavaea beijingensis]
MEHYYSYAEFLKAVGKGKASPSEQLLNDIYMDLFLKHVHREQNRERLLKLIDEALDKKDMEAFDLYAGQLKQLDDDETGKP